MKGKKKKRKQKTDRMQTGKTSLSRELKRSSVLLSNSKRTYEEKKKKVSFPPFHLLCCFDNHAYIDVYRLWAFTSEKWALLYYESYSKPHS